MVRGFFVGDGFMKTSGIGNKITRESGSLDQQFSPHCVASLTLCDQCKDSPELLAEQPK
jgi:hypothetical protein